MPIVAGDIITYLSGGAANAVPNASLGGIISSTAIVDAVLDNLFDNVSGAESSAGMTDYRCLYVKNTHATLTYQAVHTWMSGQPASPGTTITIGLDPAGNGDGSTTGVATTIANELTAPTGPTFTSPTTYAGGLVIGDLLAGEVRAIWVKRVIAAATAAASGETLTLSFQGDTAA